MIPLTPEQAGAALGLGPLDVWVSGVSIDSRSVRRGDLFVALRGERYDGHDFVGAALAGGAAAAIVERRAVDKVRGVVDSQPAARGKPIYAVDDCLEALWLLARQVRRSAGAKVFAVTGSVGKTCTKDLLRAMVGQVCRVVATEANQNNEVGVPLTLFAIEPATEAVVLEMGMRGRGQIAQLAAVAEPDVGVITNVHPVHLELLGSVEAIAQTKVELLWGLRPGGVAVVPSNSRVLQPFVGDLDCRVVRFGTDTRDAEADVVGWTESSAAHGGGVFAVRWPNGEVRIETAALPAHTLENSVAAVAACYAAGLPVDVCVRGINTVEFSGGRGQVFALPKMWVIDDTYNANPAAVRAALDHLVSVAREKGGRAVAVLGDMLELGPQSEEFHREIGEYAAASGVAALWGVGPQSVATVEGFRTKSSERTGTRGQPAAGHVMSSEESSAVLEHLLPGDVVLFKASRGIGLEPMVRSLLAEAGSFVKE